MHRSEVLGMALSGRLGKSWTGWVRRDVVWLARLCKACSVRASSCKARHGRRGLVSQVVAA